MTVPLVTITTIESLEQAREFQELFKAHNIHAFIKELDDKYDLQVHEHSAELAQTLINSQPPDFTSGWGECTTCKSTNLEYFEKTNNLYILTLILGIFFGKGKGYLRCLNCNLEWPYKK